MEDLEERRSVHSLRSSRSHTGGIGGATPGMYAQPSRAYTSTLTVPPLSVNYTEISYIDEEPQQHGVNGKNGQKKIGSKNGADDDDDDSKQIHETRI